MAIPRQLTMVRLLDHGGLVSHLPGNIDDFGMDSIAPPGSLPAKLAAVRQAGFAWLEIRSVQERGSMARPWPGGGLPRLPVRSSRA